MAVLLTRPEPDNRASAERLRAQGYGVILAPMLRFEQLAFELDGDEAQGLIVTSANALRAAAAHPALAKYLPRPLFAVGGHTAAAAREMGFRKVKSADGDAAALLALVTSATEQAGAPLLYLAAETVSTDLAAQLSRAGLAVRRRTVYRMAPVATLPEDVLLAFRNDSVEAVLLYSRRSAAAFVQAARTAGLEVGALALPQICISVPVAQAMREAGAARTIVADTPDEQSLLAALNRIAPPA